eukprot:6024597-Prymnesium_polylepis.1
MRAPLPLASGLSHVSTFNLQRQRDEAPGSNLPAGSASFMSLSLARCVDERHSRTPSATASLQVLAAVDLRSVCATGRPCVPNVRSPK